MKNKKGYSIRRNCIVLGIRRQTYHSRLAGHRPEELDQQIVDLLHLSALRTY